MKFKYYSYISIILFALIATFGYVNRVILVDPIIWSDRSLIWTDFEIVPHMEDDFDAAVYSDIYCPSKIMKDDSKVYAYMDPNQSERLLDSVYDKQLLKYEQYHFNITEYYARLMRKDIVKKGKHKLSKSALIRLFNKYEIKRDSMQIEYDAISEHNVNQQKQRYWELKIDDLLRQTAYYQNPDILSYQNYTNENTEYYKHIYHTVEHTILTAYPVSKVYREYGKCYKVTRNDNEVTIKFYKNGELTNGGYFETAITKIIHPTSTSLEIHYHNNDNSYNTDLNRSIRKVTWNENGDMSETYFDANYKPIDHNSVYKTFWKKNQKNGSIYATYYNRNGNITTNKDGSYHQKRSFDLQGRTTKIQAFDVNNKLEYDNDYIAVYEYVFDKNHKIKRVRLFNKNEDFATHLNEYNLHYVYDERGNLKKLVNLDINGDPIENKNGICIYKYTSNIYDNTTSVKRYNANKLPTTGYDDYFHEVIDYDAKGRISYKAKYHPNYVLVFDDDKNGALKYEYLNDSIFYTYNIDAFNNIFNNDIGISITKNHTDKKNRVIKEVFFDDQECYATSSEGVQMFTYTYDRKGNITQKTGLDSIGNPKSFIDDIAIIRWEYDKNNNKTKTTSYTIDDKLANGEQGTTYTIFSYNQNNMLVERSYYDKHMKPALFDEIFRTRYYYNKRNKDTLVQGFNKNKKLVNRICTTKSRYNEYGKEIRRTYYNARNQRITNHSGINTIEYLYDEQQRYIGYRNYNQYNQPVNDWNGVFSELRTLNQAGYVINYAYYDKNKKPIIGPEGYHSLQYVFDDSHFVIKESLYDIDNTLIPNSNGVAIYEYTRAASGLVHSIKYYDEHEKPHEIPDGSAEVYYEPDMNGLYYLDKKLNAEGEEIIEKELEEETEET